MTASRFTPLDDVGTGVLAVDEVREALSRERRRTVLSVLTTASTPIDVADLSRSVAAAETDASPPSVADERVQRLEASLHHVHLPKLDDADLIEYDAGRGRVEGVRDVTTKLV